MGIEHSLYAIAMAAFSMAVGLIGMFFYESKYKCAVELPDDYSRPSILGGRSALVIFTAMIMLFVLSVIHHDHFSIYEWIVVVLISGVALSFAAFDTKYQIIPNISLILFGSLALLMILMSFYFGLAKNEAWSSFFTSESIVNSIYGGVLGFLFPSSINLFIEKDKQIGFGDVKMFSVMGFATGLNSIVYLMLAAWSLQVLFFCLFLKEERIKELSMPLAPFAITPLFIGFSFL